MSLKDNGIVAASFAAGAAAGMLLCHLWTPSFCKQSTSKKSFNLLYFDLKGLGELSRLLFAFSGTPFTEKRYAINPADNWAKPEFDAHSKAGKFRNACNQVPVLEVSENGKTFSFGQSRAIERYIAAEGGLAGKSDAEKTAVDMICEHIRDVRDQARKVKDAEQDDAKKAAAFAAWIQGTVASWLEEIEAGLSATPGFAVGSSSTAADVFVFYLFDEVLKEQAAAVDKILGSLPRLSAINKRVRADERITSYLKRRPVTPF